jgi:hypothetical protein
MYYTRKQNPHLNQIYTHQDQKRTTTHKPVLEKKIYTYSNTSEDLYM